MNPALAILSLTLIAGSALGYGIDGIGYGFGMGYGLGYGMGYGRQLSGTYGIDGNGRKLVGTGFGMGYGMGYGFGMGYGMGYGLGYGLGYGYGRQMMQTEAEVDQASCMAVSEVVLQLCGDEELGGDTDLVDQVQQLLTDSEAVDRGIALQKSIMAVLDDPSFSGTVFLPSAAAFQSASEQLNDFGFDKVAAILQYHITLSKKIYVADNMDLQISTMGPFNKAMIHIQTLGSGFSLAPVNDHGDVELDQAALVEYADIDACSGVVHVIDRVLIPQELRGD